MVRLAILLGVLALACQPIPGPAPTPWYDATDAMPPLNDGGRPTGACAGECYDLQRLGCREGMPTPKGASCEVVCSNSLVDGIELYSNPVTKCP